MSYDEDGALVLKRTERSGYERESGNTEVAGELDEEGELFITIVSPKRCAYSWLTRKQTVKLRDHLTVVLAATP